MALGQRLEVQQEPLVVTLYFHLSPQQVVVAAGQDHQLKMVHLVVQVVVVLRILVRAVRLPQPVKVLQVVPTQLLEIKLLVVVAHPQLGLMVDQVVVMVVMDLQTVYLVLALLMLVVAVAGQAQHKHPLEQVGLEVVGQGLALLCRQ